MSSLVTWHLVCGLITFVLGCVMHFAYSWSGNNQLVSLITPVNESIWEHLKLLFFPVSLLSIVELLAYGNDYQNFLQVKIMSIIIGMATIVIVFYTYSGILGRSIVLVDITIFALGVLSTYLSSYYFLQTDFLTSQLARFTLLGCYVLLLVGFIIFTDSPPTIALFLDSVSKTYGRSPIDLSQS